MYGFKENHRNGNFEGIIANHVIIMSSGSGAWRGQGGCVCEGCVKGLS